MSGTKPAMSAGAALLRKILSDLAVMTVIGLVLAVLGPFGSIEQPLAVRLITWLLFSYLGYAIYSPMSVVVDRAHAALDLPRLPLWVAAVMAATVPMTVLIYVVQFMPHWPPVPPIQEALVSYSYVLVIGGAVTLLFNVIGAGGANAIQQEGQQTTEQIGEPGVSPLEHAAEFAPDPSPTPNPQSADEPAANPLLDALPPELGSDIIALEMEDHYVRVHTSLGSALVLMRLRDAMAHMAAHMPEIEGRQVHRSWWVARLAVDDIKREGRNVRLVLASGCNTDLSGGVEAPVSRAQVSELKAAGWI